MMKIEFNYKHNTNIVKLIILFGLFGL